MTMNDFVHFQRHKLLRLHMAHSKDVEVEAPETGIDEINSSRHWLMCWDDLEGWVAGALALPLMQLWQMHHSNYSWMEVVGGCWCSRRTARILCISMTGQFLVSKMAVFLTDQWFLAQKITIERVPQQAAARQQRNPVTIQSLLDNYLVTQPTLTLYNVF